MKQEEQLELLAVPRHRANTPVALPATVRDAVVLRMAEAISAVFDASRPGTRTTSREEAPND
jgi:hypothetical protein